MTSDAVEGSIQDEELVRIDTRSNSDVITLYKGLTP